MSFRNLHRLLRSNDGSTMYDLSLWLSWLAMHFFSSKFRVTGNSKGNGYCVDTTETEEVLWFGVQPSHICWVILNFTAHSFCLFFVFIEVLYYTFMYSILRTNCNIQYASEKCLSPWSDIYIEYYTLIITERKKVLEYIFLNWISCFGIRWIVYEYIYKLNKFWKI